MNVLEGHHQRRSRRKWMVIAAIVIISTATGFYFYQKNQSTPEHQQEVVSQKLFFDSNVLDPEQATISEAIVEQQKQPSKRVDVAAAMKTEVTDANLSLEVYVPVSTFNSARQSVGAEELKTLDVVYVASSLPEDIQIQLASALGIPVLTPLADTETLPDEAVEFISVRDLTYSKKLLRLDDAYYLDTFIDGAVFREISFTGEGQDALQGLKLNDFASKDTTLKVNMTGVTALTRVMQKKLATVVDPLYFSAKIGTFLADADLTHVSNEVSFRDGCPYSNTAFCSPPQFIETLKASGVDIVELTGNHNNDTGSEYNTNTINLYHQLGWATVGGGLNTAEAAKPYLANLKGSKVAFLAYNYPDSPNGGAIAGANKAGANSWNEAKITADITAAKNAGNFVIVDVQYWECYSYPDGYIEFPECDKPIGEQDANFKFLIDSGADMVVGTQAHQPQTYILYKGNPIYYGLGNLYFEQTSWPGTERGIILTHYFQDGKLIQTKLTPTIYDEALQTQIMTPEQSAYFMNRLKVAR